MERMTMKKAAIYARVSSTEQAEEGYSIHEQRRVLKEYCDKHGYDVYDEYVDSGISGKNITGRPEVQRLLRDAEDRKFDIVIVWKMNRLARKSLDLLSIVDKLSSKNIAFRSYMESYETETPSGKLQFQMMAAIAEYERNNIAENVKMGMKARAMEGRWNGGVVLGYDIVEVPGDNKKRRNTSLVINEAEAEIVRLIFTMYIQGHGYKYITSHLNRLGYKTKRKKDFSVGSIQGVISNPVHAGYIRYNVRQDWNEKRRSNINPNPILVKGLHEPIISQEMWEAAQKVHETKQKKPGRYYDTEFPLTGILRCPVCDAGMVIGRTVSTNKSGKKKVIEYYVCGAWKNKGTTVCNSNGVRKDKVDPYVLGKIESYVKDPKLVSELVKSINARQADVFRPMMDDYNYYKREIEKRKNKVNKMLDTYMDGVIDKQTYMTRSSALQAEISEFQEKLKPLNESQHEKKLATVTVAQVKNVLNNFQKAYQKSLTREQRKRIIHLLVHKITINKKREIETIQIRLNNNVMKQLKVGAGDLSDDESPAPFSTIVSI